MFGRYLFLFLLIPPNLFFLGEGAIAKQIGALIFLFSGLFFLGLRKRIAFDSVSIMLLSLVCYVTFNVIIKGVYIYSNIITIDLSDLARIYFILIFYTLGLNLQREHIPNPEYDPKLTSQTSPVPSAYLTTYLPIFMLIVLISYFYRNSLAFDLSKFYSSEDHRFSALMPGINYIWFPIVFLATYCLTNLKVSKNKIYFLSLFGMLSLSLFISASFTAIIVVGFAIFMISIIHYTLNKPWYKIVYLMLLLMVSILALYYSLPYLVASEIGLARKFQLIITLIETADYTHITSLTKRFDLWEIVLQLIYSHPITGHGSAKSVMRIADNSYFMSLFRHGLIGLLIELTIYFIIIRDFLSNIFSKKKIQLYVPLALIFAYLLAGFTTSVFYELKLPYLFFFVIGYYRSLLSNKPKTKQDVQIQ